MRFSLRLKLALLSLLLLLFPLLGMRLNNTLKNSLIISQQETLTLTAQAVSAALTDRNDLFDREQFHGLNQDRDLYLFQLSNTIQLDGKLDDWRPELAQAEEFAGEHLISSEGQYVFSSLNFRYLAGKQDKYLYAIFDVQDDHVVYRGKESLRLDRSDHLQIIIGDTHGQRTYLITARKEGWVNGFLMPDVPIKFPVTEQRIQGVWKQKRNGYILEIRIHLKLLGNKIAFIIADVDDIKSRKIKALIGTSNLKKDKAPGLLLSTSTPIEEILKSLDRPYARIRIVDRNQRIRAQVGSLRTTEVRKKQSDKLSHQINELMHPLYRFFINPFLTEFQDQASQPTELDLHGIREGLAGKHSVTSYLMEKGQVEVMAAITPLYEQDTVIGTVVVEQTTNSILSLSNRLIEETISLSVIAFLFGGCVLLFFAFRISARIRRLRNQAALAITPDGRILNTIHRDSASDEIADLGRTLDAMLSQLQQQIEHREQMADNLEHEMRTPLAGIAASVKNLRQEQLTTKLSDSTAPNDRIMEYIQWVERDVQRVEELLTSIREATTLKNALLLDSMEIFDLGKAVAVWLEHGWRPVFNEVEICYQEPEQEILIKGDPVRLRQALDKLIENAVSFHTPETPIELTLENHEDTVSLLVINQGPTIDPDKQQQIFHSMISNRTVKDKEPHLGLGLYIVRTVLDHHDGQVSVQNLSDGRTGVIFTITLIKKAKGK
ncbi:MAG: HAMP domain-containing protein [Candidatus Electrothrix sp. AU1_5]|nr:HAMP domain-containing protein [Candidatus Electrothrix sp. AX1]MCI5182943.1 HAMP domain-containing protein [Candidatus Electrothrix gigas]MCI5193692.1 HAMP domain-containing protein [Candidatus Electrothrix gigas]